MVSGNCLIEQRGKVIECGGSTHEQVCKTCYKTSLDKCMVSRHIVRLKIYDEECAVESYDSLTDIQRSRINAVLCKNDVHRLTTFVRGKLNVKHSFMRPIRSL